ncbi:RNA polymerase sigma factor [Hydrogenophaga sp.]|uniref:RNA polymerase sigma factor n=1 Tax=Hydrogenophaga sp. TaxID=1904254 RepID=UPI002727EB0B|nr:RNA polymerase sigma factor [Hydrogenophaga sp.]MDO9134407.1 RNA polymerase sigma factor [Hydrogenophaga sp.]
MFDTDTLPNPSPAPPALGTAPVDLGGGADTWFRDFLDAHGARLGAFVQRRVHNKEDAADIVQQTLLTAFLALPGFRGESLVSTWVFGIARHQVMRHFRSQPRAMQSGDDTFDALLTLEGADDPYHNVVLVQRVAIFRQVLSGLPAGHRGAWQGVVEQGSGYDDVARKLDVPVGTVRSRVSRVRAAMQQAMEQAERGPAR